MLANFEGDVRLTATKAQVWAMTAVAVVALSGATLLLQTGVQAQTIESQDTRTFQDNRVQDTRHNPVPVSPEEAARLKRLAEEAAAPEPSDSRRDTGEKKKGEAENPEHSSSPSHAK